MNLEWIKKTVLFDDSGGEAWFSRKGFWQLEVWKEIQKSGREQFTYQIFTETGRAVSTPRVAYSIDEGKNLAENLLKETFEF